MLVAAGAVSALAVALVGSGTAASTAAPTNTSAPTINGTLVVGSQLTANPGSWNGASPFTFAYQWFQCNGGCVPIAGATGAQYTPVAGDATHQLLVQVSATGSDGAISTAVNSAQTQNIAAAGGLLAAPTNVAAPAISGTTLQGSTLTAYTGQWTGTPPPTFTYLWSRCNPSGMACNPVAGATASTYVLGAADVASTMRVQVTATNSQGTVNVDSAATSIITVPLGPANTALPTITGTASVGQTLTATNGTWSGATPITYTYQWQQCNAQGASCQPISGATNQTYVVQASNAGSTLNVVVKATNADGNASATSAVTAVVGGGGPSGTTIPVSQVTLPNQLVITAYQFTPSVLRSRAPFTARFRVSDTQGHFVSGAQVNLVIVPYGRVSPAPVLTTDQDGWVTFTLNPTSKFPLIKGYLITMQARAVKPGDNILEGVTAWRLVSVRINPSS
jgi:hypothetical protein